MSNNDNIESLHRQCLELMTTLKACHCWLVDEFSPVFALQSTRQTAPCWSHRSDHLLNLALVKQDDHKKKWPKLSPVCFNTETWRLPFLVCPHGQYDINYWINDYILNKMINWPNYVESSGWVWSPSLLQPWSWTGLASDLSCGNLPLNLPSQKSTCLVVTCILTCCLKSPPAFW